MKRKIAFLTESKESKQSVRSLFRKGGGHGKGRKWTDVRSPCSFLHASECGRRSSIKREDHRKVPPLEDSSQLSFSPTGFREVFKTNLMTLFDLKYLFRGSSKVNSFTLISCSFFILEILGLSIKVARD
ncbi:hypothetical protein TNCV_790991 [Trichonephila clavipes]|nr:hypothetical protein TNCV_790991 [Trichonephila clavipes]